MIYNKDKKQALGDGAAFRERLREYSDEIFSLCEKRYHVLRTLGALGVDHQKLEQIKKPIKRIMGRK